MSDSIVKYGTPIDSVDYRFKNYVSRKKAEYSRHILSDCIMDYTYSADTEHRKKLDSIPGLHGTAKKICSTLVAQRIAQANVSWLAVGPNQFPEIYQIGCECARRLGIGVPNIYIENTTTFNAYTVAADDIEPIVVIGDLLLERYPLDELKFIIGHECGHIHNNHTMYGLLENILTSTGIFAGQVLGGALFAQLQGILTIGVQVALNAWSRAAEVTADRAGTLCADTPEAAYSGLHKLLYAGARVSDKIDTSLDMQSLRQQMEYTMDNPTRITEYLTDHPLTIKRIFAVQEFVNSDVYFDWRPDMRKPDSVIISKDEADLRCKRFINVNGKGDR